MEIKSFDGQLESQEKKPTQPDLKVDFVRHGKPVYTDEEIRSATIEGSLTEEGINQVKERAVELASRIDREKEFVVFWVSPKQRAQQTAKIIFDIFHEQNIPVIKDLRTVKSLSDVRMSPSFIEDLLENDAIGEWMEYWTESDLPEDIEKPEEVKKRVERIITYLERIARNITPEEGRRLHFICVGHEEIFRDLLEEGYRLGTKNNMGPSYGEVMSVGINKSEPGKNAKLKLDYHGQSTELDFDKESRRFFNSEVTRQ